MPLGLRASVFVTDPMSAAVLEFTARGSARAVARAIEACAEERRVISALVVPWESNAARLSLAVTSVRIDGWAIEHTNLGTITLTDLGGERTRVAIVAHEPDHPERETLARHLLKPMSSQMKQVFVTSALEAVLAAAAKRPPSNEASRSWPADPSLGGLRRSFVTVLTSFARQVQQRLEAASRRSCQP